MSLSKRAASIAEKAKTQTGNVPMMYKAMPGVGQALGLVHEMADLIEEMAKAIEGIEEVDNGE